MGQVLGRVSPGEEVVYVRPYRSIASFEAHVTLREVHTDELEITEQPVEQGAAISDHAYRRPSEVVITCAWSSTPPRSASSSETPPPVDILDIYQRLLALQASRERFDIFTGKRVYRNMLIRSLVEETDGKTENLLSLTVRCQELLIATVQVVTIAAPKEAQADPASTMPPVNKGAKQLAPGSQINLSEAIDALTPTMDEVLP